MHAPSDRALCASCTDSQPSFVTPDPTPESSHNAEHHPGLTDDEPIQESDEGLCSREPQPCVSYAPFSHSLTIVSVT
ncbi:hypothetical protein SCLCIDRAFT_1217649 [Scleroderma citrinum Foug A]|uniref:Uncharacterized protein n=1 Tax=Scleroderma citrinum Foug A TaxID=1036808 RepID=A0A0C3DTL4_9AGAM|nr:hypothetical protein SCLCIDRAFT_1217649 [Scleroderma citrinum Foug A]